MKSLALFQFSITLSPSLISRLSSIESRYRHRKMVLMALPNSARARYTGCFTSDRRKRRKMSSVSAVPSLMAVAYLTIWSYCSAIRGIAEFERDLIRERTGAGRADAKKRGVRFGRPKKMNEDQRNLACRLIKEGKSVSEVARTFSIHSATLY